MECHYDEMAHFVDYLSLHLKDTQRWLQTEHKNLTKKQVGWRINLKIFKSRNVRSTCNFSHPVSRCV